MFLIPSKLEHQKKILGFRNMQEKLEKDFNQEPTLEQFLESMNPQAHRHRHIFSKLFFR